MRSARASRDQRGQATVELALVLPFVLTLALALVQVGLVARDSVRVTHAARSGARAAAVGFDDESVRRAAVDGSGLAASRLSVVVWRADGWVTVEVTYRCPTDVPLVGTVAPAVVLRDQLTMRLE
jgi:Flp pilus assembly protein TadG